MDRAEVVRHGASKAVVTLPNRTSTREFSDRIHAALRKGVEGILETGRLLIEAKAQVERGAFEAMVLEKLPFKLFTARRLMAIARNPLLSAHVRALPPSWRTLYDLTRLTDDTLRARLADGTITPKMERSDVVMLRGEQQSKHKRRPSSEPITACVDYVRARIEEIGVARRAELIARLPDAIDRLEALTETSCVPA
jgi:hypothetical protein